MHRPPHIHPVVYDVIQRAGPQNCFYYSSQGPVDAPGVGEPLDRASNLITGSEITAEQPTLSAQPVQGAGGGVVFSGDDLFSIAPVLGVTGPVLFAAVGKLTAAPNFQRFLSLGGSGVGSVDLTAAGDNSIFFRWYDASGQSTQMLGDVTQRFSAVLLADPTTSRFEGYTMDANRGAQEFQSTESRSPDPLDQLSFGGRAAGGGERWEGDALSALTAPIAPPPDQCRTLRDALYYSHVTQS